MIAFLLAQTIAITGGTVYPVSGPKLENATVLIRDGRIAAVGTNVAVPQDATRIDASGKWVTPGLIDGAGQMGLREIGAVQNTNENQQRGDDVAAAFNVLRHQSRFHTDWRHAHGGNHDDARRSGRQSDLGSSGAHRSRWKHDRGDARQIAGCDGRGLE